MTYLLAKYALLFLLTAILGFVLGYWWSRRKFEDVSESYEDLRVANARSDDMHWDRLWKHLYAIPEPKETDLSGVFDRLDTVEKAVRSLPQPEPVDLSGLEDRLDTLDADIRGIPVPEKPKDVDFKPLLERLDALSNGVRSMPKPAMPEDIDLRPIVERLDRVDRDIKAIPVPEKPLPVDFGPLRDKLDRIESSIREIPQPEPQRPVDLNPLQRDLSQLRQKVEKMPVVETQPPVDFGPLSAQVDSLSQRVDRISRPQPVDLKPLDKRLQAIESELGGLKRRLVQPANVERVPRRSPRKVPRILKSALYGKKDNLQLITGVGPKLEKLLNQNGVFYFWQVAHWNRSDIDIIDERLDAFKGRIGRDDWVSQAKRLSRAPEAARMPAS